MPFARDLDIPSLGAVGGPYTPCSDRPAPLLTEREVPHLTAKATPSIHDVTTATSSSSSSSSAALIFSSFSIAELRRDFLIVTKDVYEGEFVDDELYGRGTYEDEGEFQALTPQGQVKLTYASGAVYEGAFEAGKFHCKGKYKFANGCTYEGIFVDGEPHGQGTFRSANGEVYEGEYRADERHGQGMLICANDIKIIIIRKR